MTIPIYLVRHIPMACRTTDPCEIEVMASMVVRNNNDLKQTDPMEKQTKSESRVNSNDC